MKVEVYEYINSLLYCSKNPTKYILSDEPTKFLSQTCDYVKALMFQLRDRHDLVYKILKFSKIEQIHYNSGYNPKESLANLFTGSFYENILSSSFIETDLLIIFFLTLKNEISNLNPKPKQNEFLKEISINSYMIKGLINKDDIKSYFKIILQNILEAIDNREDVPILSLNQKELRECIEKIKNKLIENANSKKTNWKNNALNDIILPDDVNIIDDNFSFSFEDEILPEEQKGINEYLENFTKEVLIKKMQEEKDENVKGYIIKQLSTFQDDDGLFANNKFLEDLYKGQYSAEIFTRYRKNFVIIKDYIDKIFKNLNSNIQIIPYSIRCISKMIGILIEKKDPTIKEIDKNAFIASFFFEGLLKPFLTQPEINSSFTIFLLPETQKVLHLIQQIISKLVSGRFFTSSDEESDYTSFNKFFCDIMPNVLMFFKNLIDVKLPPFIEKLIEGTENEETFIYNYFKENPNECIAHRAFCFCIDDILEIIRIIKKYKTEFFNKPNTKMFANSQKSESDKIFKIILERFNSTDIYINLLTKIRDKDKSKNQRTFLLLTDIQYNGRMKKLSKLDFKSQSFMLKEKKGNEKENNLIKCKNFFSQILFNFQELNEEIFASAPINTTENILKSLQNFLQIDYYLFYNSIPLGWYGKSLCNLLENIPNEYKEKDYFKFYEELIKNVQEAIDLLDIRELGKITCKLNYTRRALKNIKQYSTKVKQTELNNKINSYINKAKIEVYMHTIFDSPKSIFYIKQLTKNENLKTLQNLIFLGKGKHKTNAYSIREFIKNFPNVVEMQKVRPDRKLFELEGELQVDSGIKQYLKLVKLNLKKESKLGSFYEEGYLHIKNYLMNTLYPKLYPEEPSEDDIKIFKKCVELSWIEPNNIMKSKNLILDNFLQETVGYILRLDKEKSPLKKMGLILKVSQVIHSTLVFSTGKQDNSIDDSLPLFQYAIIKAQPLRLASNATYIEMFLSEEEKQMELGILLGQLEATVENLKDFTYDKLFDVTEEEYKRYLYI